jgi:hypothetical protein
MNYAAFIEAEGGSSRTPQAACISSSSYGQESATAARRSPNLTAFRNLAPRIALAAAAFRL